ERDSLLRNVYVPSVRNARHNALAAFAGRGGWQSRDVARQCQDVLRLHDPFRLPERRADRAYGSGRPLLEDTDLFGSAVLLACPPAVLASLDGSLRNCLVPVLSRLDYASCRMGHAGQGVFRPLSPDSAIKARLRTEAYGSYRRAACLGESQLQVRI